MANNFSNSINSTIGSSNSGANNTLTIQNTSNTAASQANALITVGGATADDPFTTYTVTGATSWSEGIDNSVSDNFVIAASTALGTTNVVSMTTGGAVSVVLGDLSTTRSSSGATVASSTINGSNTASSNALQQVTVAGTSAGDALTTYTVTGATNWSVGVDNSASDAFVVAASTALGTTNVISAAVGGSVNLPLTPAFYAYLTSNATNTTGDSTVVSLNTGTPYTEITDQGSNLATTGIFTAPVAGMYILGANFQFNGTFTLINQITLRITTTSRTVEQDFNFSAGTWGSSTGVVLCNLFPMAAGDTAYVKYSAAGATKVVGLNGGDGNSVFYGYLAC